MSYAQENSHANKVSMGAAIMVNGSIILAVALSPIIAKFEPGPKTFFGHNIPAWTPPPKTEQKVQPKNKAVKTVVRSDPVIKTNAPVETGVITTGPETATGLITAGAGSGDDFADFTSIIPKTPTPIFKSATRDPRYIRNFQPDYPVAMLRQEIEGSVTVRILVGIDGRVRQVQTISATDSSFARVTEKQALSAWRFKPATRDGIAVEDWQTLSVRFDIN
jgi:protein TonB